MRIGLVTGEFPPDQGGVGDFTFRLAEAMVALGCDVHVITGPLRTLEHETRPPFPVHRAVPSWRWGCWRGILRVAQETRLELLNLQYQAAAYGMHPAVHFLPQPSARPPVVVTFHDLRVPYLFPKAGPLRWQVVRMLARRADGVIVTNREDYLRLEGEIPRDRLALIPIGSNIPPTPPPGYDPLAERTRWGVGPGDLLLGYFGFLNESKGGEELIRALALLVARGVPAHLLMIGGRVGTSDPTNRAYAAFIDGLIAELGLTERVHWTGYTDPPSVSAGLLATDVCILPYRDGVSFRRGTLHACLAHGRAIVTTCPAVPLPEVRDGENMLLVPSRDADALAEAVLRLWRDPALRARLEAGARALATDFSWDRIARQTVAFLSRWVSG
ncbi:MAG: glycosyltransferase family 4 protein [Anaerolineae bacterium]|nr:glycosyltransferase family 4 protein [Anaerolineae bacterium]MDW8069513.1 glycosyltransferase family 4 protein [Anaerolineae bacterium]